MAALGVMALANWTVIRREQEREKASRWGLAEVGDLVPGCAELSGSLSDGDAAEVLDAVFVRQIVDDFGEFRSHLRRRRVPRGRLLTIVELDGDEVMAHGQPPDGAPMAQRYRETVKSAL
jgi:hypothetical protein